MGEACVSVLINDLTVLRSTGWQADYIGDQFILGPGPQAVPPSQQMGNAD